jgi:predicted dehydrogenase
MRRLRWGVLSTASIGRFKVIPGIQQAPHCEVVAIASRDAALAASVAGELGIPKAHGSYEALLADPEIDAIYNPLPNHLHAPLTIKALDAGKHVLCEKPIALNAEEALQIEAAQKTSGKLVAEAFMVRFHPQWQRAREVARSGRLGDVRAIHTFFSYYLTDPDNIRNQAEIGGGAEIEEFTPADQYQRQGDAFSRAILEESSLEFPMGDAIMNMRILDALFRSEKSKAWETVVAG